MTCHDLLLLGFSMAFQVATGMMLLHNPMILFSVSTLGKDTHLVMREQFLHKHLPYAKP
jgi:hypothetical protein